MTNCLKVERARRNLTQQDVAQAVGVSRQTILAIESRKYVPSAVLALKLAAFLAMPVETLFALEPGE
ncbi:helix-turn-helix transcriptional regulator [Hymenobacter koreensis]|uniref:Helix-turn-helix transcriptional regulator n=1 Tax=Hymenobacter koreensis TaxID=1084523 RepID=A0ABP8J391_9BACT